MNADGSIKRCKARLVAQGYSQKEGHNMEKLFVQLYDQNLFALALTSKNGLQLLQMKITTAFLSGDLEVYLQHT